MHSSQSVRPGRSTTASSLPGTAARGRNGVTSSATVRTSSNHKNLKPTPSQLIESVRNGTAVKDSITGTKIIQFLNIYDYSTEPDCKVPLDRPIFQPVPDIVQFRDFEPFKTYEVAVAFRNNDSVMRQMKVIPPDSMVFKVIPHKRADQRAKIAPGMELLYTVQFTPTEKIDYSYDLICVTEREKFIVPIRAYGSRALLQIADQVEFGACPVKHPATKTLLITNIGEKPTKFLVSTVAPFHCSTTDGFLEVNQSQQITLSFIPQQAQSFEGELVLEYDGLKAAVRVLGTAENANVFLSRNHMVLSDTYIALQSQKTFKIINKSDVPVTFDWRAFPNVQAELDQKLRLNLQLNQEETEERLFLEDAEPSESDSEEDLSDSSDEPDGDKSARFSESGQPRKKNVRALAALSRKYRNIRKAVEEDIMLFEDDIFQIEPVTGTIWADSELTVTVTFRPQAALEYTCSAYCNITGREERLTLQMKGEGIGPRAVFSFTELDIGDIFIDSVHRYSLTLENRGEIEASFSLLSSQSPFSWKFNFFPDSGVLAVGATQEIEVEFCSDLLGEFQETFEWSLQGSTETLKLTFRGHVIPPSFGFDTDDMDFGLVSYGFLNSKLVTLTNTSEVPMRFMLKVPGDGKYLQREFDIVPAKGVLYPNASQKIQIDFIANSIRKYDMSLVVDLEGVGSDLFSIPIKAECVVPEVRLQPADTVDFGECFIRYPYSREIRLVNESRLPAKFEILPQDDQSKILAVFSPDQEKGNIPPQAIHTVTITSITEKLGSIRLPVYVKIVGSPNPSLPLTLLLNSIGPKVVIEKEEVDWGQCQVLKNLPKKITVFNDSLIPAEFKAFTKNKDSVWRVNPRSGLLEPQQKLDLQVIAMLDEVQKFTDILNVVVAEGTDIAVTLKAKGIGSTMYCAEDLSSVDFGTQYTTRQQIREVLLENKGRKQQKLTWAHVDPSTSGRESTMKDVKRKEGEGVEPIFSVFPESVILEPKTALLFQLRALAPTAGHFSERLVCRSVVGSDRQSKVVFDSTMSGQFIDPLLKFSKTSLHFRYVWARNVSLVPMSQTVDLTNVSALPVSFVIRSQPPFSVDCDQFSLEPGQTSSLRIDYDPGHKFDKVSGKVKTKLGIIYKEHPQRDAIDLIGEVCYPNLSFEYTKIDFGCILNDTSKRNYMAMTNTSELPVAYEWSFVEDDELAHESGSEADSGVVRTRPQVPINQIFDILPIRGLLQPGESENVEFVFYGLANHRFDATVMCAVEGGPDYEVTLHGEGSAMSYRLDKTFIDFGVIPFEKSETQEFYIRNEGKVSYEFQILTHTLSRPNIVDINPLSGKVPAGERQKVVVKFYPGVPDRIMEHFLVQVAHFEPTKFVIQGEGQSPAVCVALPRITNPAWEGVMEKVKEWANQDSRAESAVSSRPASGTSVGRRSRPVSRADSPPGRRSGPTSRSPSPIGGRTTLLPTAATDGQLAGHVTARSVAGSMFSVRLEQLELEAEADRRYMCQLILSHMENNLENTLLKKTVKDPAASIAYQSHAGGFDISPEERTTTNNITATFGSTVKTAHKSGAGSGELRLAEYICDFGNLVLSNSRKKQFKLTNMSPLAVSFSFDKKQLAARGFTIEPEKVTRLPPKESVMFTVMLQTRKTDPVGQMDLSVPITVRNGPSYILHLKANLTVPDVTLSSDVVDFGRLMVGQTQMVMIRVVNTREVPVEWAVSTKDSKKEKNDAGNFQLTPSSGILQPGQKMRAELRFTPTDERSYSYRLPLKMKESPIQRVITCKGVGYNLSVAFNPTVVSLGPVLPNSTQAEAIIEMTNPNDQAVEVFSVDFDKLYLEEEEATRRYDEGFDGTDSLLLPVRRPGEGYYPYIMASYRKKKRKEDEIAAVQAAAAQAALAAQQALEAPQEEKKDPKAHQQTPVKKSKTMSREPEKQAAPAVHDKPAVASIGVVAAVGGVSIGSEATFDDESDDFLPPREPVVIPRIQDADRHNVLVFGPPLSGQSTVAAKLVEHHPRFLIRWNELVEWAMARGTPAGLKAKDLIESNRGELKTQSTTNAVNAPPAAAGAAAGKAGNVPATAGKGAPAAGAAGTKGKPGSVVEPEVKSLPCELLAEILHERVHQTDCNAGVVIDGLACRYAKSLEDTARAVLEGLKGQTVQLVLLNSSGKENPDLNTLQEGVNGRLQTLRAQAQALLSETDKSPTDVENVSAEVKAQRLELIHKRQEAEKLLHRSSTVAAAVAAFLSSVTFVSELFRSVALTPQEMSAAAAAQAQAEKERRREERLRERQLEKEREERERQENAKKEDKKGKDDKKQPTAAQQKEREEKRLAELAKEDERRKAEDERLRLEAEEKKRFQQLIAGVNRIFSEVDGTRDVDWIVDLLIKVIVPEPHFPDPNDEPLPAPQTKQIVKRPIPRPVRPPVAVFSILTPLVNVETAETQYSSQTRWLLPPMSSQQLLVKYCPKTVGKTDRLLSFEVVGCQRDFGVLLHGTCAFPTITQDSRNVFMRRTKTRPPGVVSKQFIITENVYEFGPLLVGKNPDKRHDETVRVTNGESFRITNNGLFDLRINFSLKSKASVDPNRQPCPFVIEPEFLELKPEQTEDLRVWAFPQEEGIFKDEIIGIIKDNPEPVLFPIQCSGSKPAVTMDRDNITFEKLLLDRTERQTLTLTNTSLIPVAWRFKGIETLPSEFSVTVNNGVLAPSLSASVDFVFRALTQKSLKHDLTLEVSDTEGLNLNQVPKPLPVVAEAFDIAVGLNLPVMREGEKAIDFDAVRIGEEKVQTFTVCNNGKYNVKFEFNIRKKLIRDIFTIEPMSGDLAPKEEKQITIRCNAMSEIRLKDNNDIRMRILEAVSLEVHQTVPISVSVNAVYSKYSITPLRGLNFGPVEYEREKTRTFEIRNNGLFEFGYTIQDNSNLIVNVAASRSGSISPAVEDKRLLSSKSTGPAAPATASKTAAPAAKVEPKKPDSKVESKAKPGQKKDIAAVTQIGPFLVSPFTGTVAPDSSVTVEVTFKAQGDEQYNNVLNIHIAGRDPTDHPSGILYDLSGESCVPGINTQDAESIFEEQTVVSVLDTQNLQTKMFAEEERVFSFGAVIWHKFTNGVQEKFRITNPNKIPCTVTFDVKPRVASKSEAFAFEVQPASVTIPPHEYRYATVAFRPSAMTTYRGIFTATVERGTNSKTKQLTFELRGEGTMPTVLLEKPNTFNESNQPVLRFKKLQIGKSQVLPVTITNRGIIPATVKIESPDSDMFSFTAPSSATLEPKRSQSFDMRFMPLAIGQFTSQIKFQTMNNPYETSVIQVVGEGYREDVVFEDIPDELEDELRFGDCVVGVEKQLTFTVRNQADMPIRFQWEQTPDFVFSPGMGHIQARTSRPITVTFKANESKRINNLILPVSVAKIQYIGAAQEWDDSMKNLRWVTAEELAQMEREKKEKEAAAAAAASKAAKSKPAAKSGGTAPTDPKKKETKETTTRRPSQPEQPMPSPPPSAPSSQETRREGDQILYQVIEISPEPAHTVLDGTAKQLQMKLDANADLGRYHCPVKSIQFKPTMMFASRVFKFPLKNLSLTRLDYQFVIERADGRPHPGPYSISPESGTVSAQSEETITVRFNPMEVEEADRVIVCHMNNLANDMAPLCIPVSGTVLRPICHFELSASNYHEKRIEEARPLDPLCKVIEFSSLGTKVRNTKRFYVLNPTNQSYSFNWECVDTESSSVFRCLTTNGLILSGKKFEMIFEYVPDQVGTHESNWQFRIPDCDVIQAFLLVGTVNEPNVTLDIPHINFGPLLIGSKSRETVTIVNNEHIPFAFNFTVGEEASSCLDIVPASGVVGPETKFPVEITFRPTSEKGVNMNLVCQIKRKVRPLILNIKGEGYDVHHSVYLEEESDGKPLELSPTGIHELDYELVHVNERSMKQIVIVNSGNFNFDFTWKRAPNRMLMITPEQGTVKRGDKLVCQVGYLPLTEHQLDNYKATLQIVAGQSFHFVFKGRARKPAMDFSFTSYDFGHSFIGKDGSSQTANLLIRNSDSVDMSIECPFERKPFLDVRFSPTVLPPGGLMEVPIIFTAKDITEYRETVPFHINGTYTINVAVSGAGTGLRLELVNPEQQAVDFGILKVGHDSRRNVKVVNKSKREVSFVIVDNENLLEKHGVSFSPLGTVTLRPKESTSIDLRFQPLVRVPAFKADLNIQVGSELKRLLVCSGACHGLEMKLLEDSIGFGTVVQNSRSTKRVQLSNFGDIGARFKWETRLIHGLFTIQPSEGFLSAHDELMLDVTFHPTQVDHDIRFDKIPCYVDGGETLYVTLTGKCISQPSDATKEISFATKARETVTDRVKIENPTSSIWRLRPVITTTVPENANYWSGAEYFEINGNSSAEYEITYKPLSMSKDAKHEGSLFFPLPDGTAHLYKLWGQAAAPTVAPPVLVQVVAKSAHTHSISVKNWLATPQHFVVTTEVVGTADASTVIKGPDSFDVPGSVTKEYKLNFLALKHGVTVVRVTFTNPTTAEFTVFEVKFEAAAAGFIEKFLMETSVRQPVTRLLSIENPLDEPVEFESPICDRADVRVEPSPFTIQPRSEGRFTVVYRPLVAGQAETSLTLRSAKLGEYKYKLTLKANPGGIERSLNFRSFLGSDLVQTFRFNHLLSKAIHYTCTIDNLGKAGPPDFFVDKTVSAPAATAAERDGVEVRVDVRYEPSSLGDSKANLIIASPEGGDFVCSLHGVCAPPNAQGPITIMNGKSASIEFRNPFVEPMEFSFKVDHPAFVVASAKGGASGQRIDSKKTASVQVSFKPSSPQPCSGRLIISCGENPPWVYYLQGLTN